MEKESELLWYNAKVFIESFTEENNSLEILFSLLRNGKTPTLPIWNQSKHLR